jgi:uncharacterized protein (TIGR04255 family)
LLPDYPHGLEGSEDHVTVERSSETTSVSHTRMPRGYAFTSNDHGRVVQVRTDGFTFNWVGEYRDWDALSSAAVQAYQVYLSVARPENVVRVGLRYVNRFDVPDKSDIPTITRLYTNIPDGLPQRLGGEMVRVLLRFEEPTLAIVASVLEPLPDPKGFALTLDIDVFQRGEFSFEPDAVWKQLEDLREVKNRIFFSTLTEQTLDHFR